MLWVGAKLLLKPRDTLETGGRPPIGKGPDAFRRGFLTNLFNPKVGVFYVTFLPQFVPTGAPVAGYTFFFTCAHVMLTSAWFAALIAATVPLGWFVRQPKAIRTLDRPTGGVFVAFDLKLATSTAH